MQEWIKAAQAGEQAAWNILYQHHYPGLYARALQLCRRQDAAKDAVQDAFVTAWLKLAQLRDAATFGAWLRKILEHTCYRMLHRHQPMQSAELLATHDRYSEDTLGRRLDEMATQNRLYTTLAHLPPTLRSTMMLRYFSGYRSYADIATILSIPVGTVRSRINEAKTKLAAHWQQHNDAGGEALKAGEEWNQFYYAHFGNMHYHDDYRDRMLNHLAKDMTLVYTSGKTMAGRHLLAKEVQDDRAHGSWMEPVNVVSTGNVSVVEARCYNSAEHPHRCPPNAVFVLHREKDKASKMHFHLV